MTARGLATAVLLALLGAAAPATAVDLAAFLAQVERGCRFDQPARADLRVQVKDGTGERTYEAVAVFAKGDLYLELREPAVRVLARADGPEASLASPGGAPIPQRTSAHDPLGATTLVPSDFAPFRASVQRTPQITSETRREILVTGAPAAASPYVLLVYLLDREKLAPTRIQYYERTINNLVRLRRDADFVQVAGQWRPGRSEIEDYRSGAVTTIAYRWRAPASVPADLFDPARLAGRPSLLESSPTGAGAPPRGDAPHPDDPA
jgi:hypothetical protein